MKANQFEFYLTDLSGNNSKFRDVNVKLDEEGILRCEGRVKFRTHFEGNEITCFIK